MIRFDWHIRAWHVALVLQALALVATSSASFALDAEAGCVTACCCCCEHEASAPVDVVSGTTGCSCQSAPAQPVSTAAEVTLPDSPQGKRLLSLLLCSASTGVMEVASFPAATPPPLRTPFPHDTLVTQFVRINC